ncbi:MAG: hypothetical protein VCF24_10450 [Candidatus Latescibacterota bacterium]
MRNLAALTALVVCVTGCGDDNPTGPESDLVGSWDLVGTNLFDIPSEGFTDALVEDGASRFEALLIVELVLSETSEEDFVADLRSTIRFNGNRTYEDNSGDEGTWGIEGNDLTMVSEEGSDVRFEFFLDGDDLTLILTGERFIEEMRTERTDDDSAEDIALMEEDIALMERVLDDDDVMRFFYRRRK